jgi:hypothetical protein
VARKERLKLILTTAAVALAVGSMLHEGSLRSTVARTAKSAVKQMRRPRGLQERFK